MSSMPAETTVGRRPTSGISQIRVCYHPISANGAAEIESYAQSKSRDEPTAVLADAGLDALKALLGIYEGHSWQYGVGPSSRQAQPDPTLLPK
jgi:hypothetical protein